MHQLFEDMPHFVCPIGEFEVKDVNELLVKSELGSMIMDFIYENRSVAGPLPKKKTYEIIDYVSGLEDGVEELKSTKIENVLSW